MKILLINPPRDNELIGQNPTVIESERGYNPPLGLLYIAASLREKTSHSVEVIDAQVEELSYPRLGERIRSSRPDVVGISCMTFTLLDALKTATVVKDFGSFSKRALGARAAPRPSIAGSPGEARGVIPSFQKRSKMGIPVVFGGSHVHLFPEETIRLPVVDYAVLGEGEEAFVELLDRLEDKRALASTPGIVFTQDDGRIVNTGIRPFIGDLDVLPFPARDLVPYRKYSSILARRLPVTTMFTSRGCPFRCSFCDRPHLGKKFRARSAKNVVDEMEQSVRMGIHEILMYDDTFTVRSERVMEICREILRRRLDVGWDIRTRVDTVTPDMIEALRKAGCRGIHYGVESGTEKILKVLNKGITVQQAREVFQFTRKAGIMVLAYFMIGCPTETRQDIETTLRVMNSLQPDYAHITILTPFPGTKIYLDGLRSGMIRRDYWREFAANPQPDFSPPHWPEIPAPELQKIIRRAYRSFYFRPAYLARRLTKVRSFGELKRKAKSALAVLKWERQEGASSAQLP